MSQTGQPIAAGSVCMVLSRVSVMLDVCDGGPHLQAGHNSAWAMGACSPDLEVILLDSRITTIEGGAEQLIASRCSSSKVLKSG